jgi:hypothetical protein
VTHIKEGRARTLWRPVDALARQARAFSRPDRLKLARLLLTELRDEAQFWLDHRPANYSDTDDNAERHEKIEEFTGELTNIIEYVDQLEEVPRFITGET